MDKQCMIICLWYVFSLKPFKNTNHIFFSDDLFPFQVASTGVRNTGTLAGNLMLKHEHQYFPSDCFLMLETLGANVVVASATEHGKEYKYSPEEWLKVSMDRKVVKKFTLPALSKTHVYRTFKITPRLVHAHAYVNAGFLVRVF